MNKKLVIVFTIIGLVVIGGVIGFICYRNSPDYVMKQYVKLINDGKYDKLNKYEYNYEDFKIKSSIKNHKDTYNGDNAYIKNYKVELEKTKDNKKIMQYTYTLYPIVGKNYNNISEIKVFAIDTEYHSLDHKFGGMQLISIGKVGLKWKVVYSQFYYLE